MKCPECGAWVQIKETRKQEDNTKLRRYECGNLHRFKTVEQIVSKTPIRQKSKAAQISCQP